MVRHISNKALEGQKIIKELETLYNIDSKLEEGEVLKTIKKLLDKKLPDLLESDKDTIEII